MVEKVEFTEPFGNKFLGALEKWAPASREPFLSLVGCSPLALHLHTTCAKAMEM
jgi:hypothetical protein